VGSDRSATEQPSIKKGLKRRRRRATQPTVQPSNPQEAGDADPLAERRARREERILDALDAMHFNHEDRYHELPEGERKLIRAWVSDNAAPRNVTIARHSYELKHVAEQFLRLLRLQRVYKRRAAGGRVRARMARRYKHGLSHRTPARQRLGRQALRPAYLRPELALHTGVYPRIPRLARKETKQWLRK
jgi:hypothetical protein